MVTGERPGYGRSTRLPGRGFAEHADDMARLLDHLGLDRVYVCGESGGAPRALALAARHPQRLRAASILSGMAPLTDEEATQVIPINQRARRLVAAHDVDGLRTLLTPIAAEMLADPLAGYAAQMATAPPEDHTVMTDPLWQQGYIRATREALGTGIDGWVDETLAILGDWPTCRCPRSPRPWCGTTPTTTATCRCRAARGLVDHLPNATLGVWPDRGHFAAYRREGQVLDELLTR